MIRLSELHKLHIHRIKPLKIKIVSQKSSFEKRIRKSLQHVDDTEEQKKMAAVIVSDIRVGGLGSKSV